MRKTAAVIITLALLASFTMVATAEDPPDPILPGEGLHAAMSGLEQAKVETSEGLPEQALLQNEFANRRMDALDALEALGQAEENAEGFGAEVIAKVIEELMGYLTEHEENLGLIIAEMAIEMASDKDVPANAGVLEGLADEINARGLRLAKIMDDGNLPEEARAGAEKALVNMEAAAKKAAWALGRGTAGPPPWAGSAGDDNGASQDPAAPPGEATPPVDTPPDVDAPPDVGAPPVTPPNEDLPGDAPPGDAPPVKAPPVKAPPGDAPPVEDLPADAPPVDAPPVDAPPDGVPVDGDDYPAGPPAGAGR